MASFDTTNSLCTENIRRKTLSLHLGERFTYARMPFGLINAGATFQRAMDITLLGDKDKFVVIYLDNFTIFSKTNEEKIKNL